ncbi:MAG: 1-acyl-sn-glycerol-3-phosphate acyltransferase [Acidimicrobiia bacterium]|nr:1-acyl-sn-glycerol-3-phosphate acyltransferase [Acidimicrobiia bacterium]
MEEILDRLSVRELRSLAKALDLVGRSSMNKVQLVASVANGLKASEPRPENPSGEPGRRFGMRGEERRRATRDRLGSLVDRDRICNFVSIEGFTCGLPPVGDNDRCALHGGTDISDLAIPAAGTIGFDTWPALIRHLQMASYDIDALGLDPVIAEMLWHLGNYVYFDYFRVTAQGLEHVPMEGAAVLASNHGGAAIPYDALMLQMAVTNEAPLPRRVRVIGTEIFNMIPTYSHLYRKSGAAYAAKEDAMWVLENGHLLGVFPEGVQGFQKPSSDAYRLQRFGRGGFVKLAMRSGAPIVPVAILGSEEVHPALFTSKRLAQLVRLVFPQQRVEEMAVWLNPIPLPVRWQIRFLEPIEVGPATDRPDRLTVLETAETVRARVQKALDAMLRERTSIF